MFQRNDVAKLFRAASFAAPGDVAAFVARAGPVTSADIPKVLTAVVDLASKESRAAHHFRCEVLLALTLNAPGPELFVPFLRALKSADETLRATLLSALPRVNHVPAHGELVDMLASADPSVRATAAEVLTQVAGKTVLEMTTRRALESNFHGRNEAMGVFVARAAQHSLPLLVAVLQAGKPQEKIQALRYLADKTYFARDPEGAVDAACVVMQDRDDLVVAQAINTLGELAGGDFLLRVEPLVANRGLVVLRAFLNQAAKRPGEVTAAMLRDRFREGPKAARLVVLEAIEAAGSEAFFGTLVEALSHRDVVVRSRAAHAITALSKSGEIDAARAIVWLLRSKDVNVRRLAAEIANRIEDKHGTLAPRLLKFLRDEDWWVRERVLDALIELDTPAITRHIVKDYLSDRSGVVRRFAVSALLRIADPRSLGALLRTAQNDEDWLVAELAVEAIAKLGDDRATAYLIDLLGKRSELRVACICALCDLKAVDALPDVAELTSDPDPDVRAAAIRMLELLDDGTHALWAKACEDDPSASVREAAGRVLRRFHMQRASDAPIDARSLDALLAHAVAKHADDLFLLADRAPFIKCQGKMQPLGTTVLAASHIRELVEPHLSPAQRSGFEAGREIDFSYELASRQLRFRVNVFQQLTGIGVVLRTVKNDIRSLEALALPAVVATFADYSNGLVLIGGPTGAGKSTTLAALVDHINRHQARHIVTVEDPLEVIHRPLKSLLTQRELGAHTRSFKVALRSALRQDPDVILVGELRDLETIAFAVSAAETGHLVFGTVHTTSADATIDRLLNVFGARQQGQVRGMLAESLRAVTSQYLLPTPQGGERLPAVEVMINNDAIQSLIRKGKAFQIPTVIATSRDQGMQLMDVDLIRLAKAQSVVLEDAYAKSVDKRAFEAALGLPPSETGEMNPQVAGSRDATPPEGGPALPRGGHQSVRSGPPPSIGRKP